MRYLVLLVSITVLFACQSSVEESIDPAQKDVFVLNTTITEVITLLADSISTCDAWLSKDYELRRFFTESDSLANYLSDYFDHDQIVSWYQSIDTTTMLDLSQYLYDLDVPYISEVDSLQNGCASAINAMAFSHENKECLLLFVEMNKDTVRTYTYLLERPDNNWYIADTLSQVKTAR